MKKYRFKIFYFDAHEKLIGTDVITQFGCKPEYEMAYEFASLMAESHHPTCTRLEVCRLADKKDFCVGITEA